MHRSEHFDVLALGSSSGATCKLSHDPSLSVQLDGSRSSQTIRVKLFFASTLKLLPRSSFFHAKNEGCNDCAQASRQFIALNYSTKKYMQKDLIAQKSISRELILTGDAIKQSTPPTFNGVTFTPHRRARMQLQQGFIY